MVRIRLRARLKEVRAPSAFLFGLGAHRKGKSAQEAGGTGGRNGGRPERGGAQVRRSPGLAEVPK